MRAHALYITIVLDVSKKAWDFVFCSFYISCWLFFYCIETLVNVSIVFVGNVFSFFSLCFTRLWSQGLYITLHSFQLPLKK